jgi:recombination protein RecA
VSESSCDVRGLYEKAVKEQGVVDRGPVPYVVSTGSVLLDRALVIGGLPGGRIVEIFGLEASGKTTLALHACVSAQRMGLPFGIVDMETALDVQYFRNLGVQGDPNVDWLCVSPETGEDAFSIIEAWLKGGVKVIVVDSVAVMTPQAELDGEMGEAFMGLQARMMGQGLRKVSNLVNKSGALLIFINQTRQKIGVQFGNPETTTGGNALKFYCSVRLHTIQVGDPINGPDGEQIGKHTKVTVKKNKLAPPMKTAMVPIVWGRGVAREIELLDVLITEGVMSKSSSYFSYKDEKVNGKQAAYELVLRREAELLAALDAKRSAVAQGAGG